MDRLLTIEVFVRVAQAQSFSRAAEALKLPRSNVSVAIRELEERLGTRLINRTTRSMSLTPDGAAYLDWCTDLLANMDHVEHAIADGAARPVGRLRVDVPSRIARRVVCPALPSFLERYPDIELHLGMSDRFADIVRDGVDCAIRVGTLEDSALVARPIGALRMVNVASPEYLARHGTPATLVDLERHRIVGFASNADERSAARWWYAVDDGESSIPMRADVFVDDAESYIACCQAGVGLVQVPAYDVVESLARGELVEVLPAFPAAPMPISALYPERRFTPGRVQVFVDWVQDLYNRRMQDA